MLELQLQHQSFQLNIQDLFPLGLTGWILQPKGLSSLLQHHSITAYSGASPMAQMVKNLPAMQETQVQSLCQEDSLEEGMAAHSSILA